MLWTASVWPVLHPHALLHDLPFVDHLGGQERSLLVRWMQIRGRNDPRSTQVILLLLPVERRLGLFDWNSEAGRLERVDGRFLVHHVFGRFPGANPLHRIEPTRKAYLTHLLVLVALQPHALPFRHFALLFRGHVIFFLALVACPRSLPVLDIRGCG